LFKSVQNYGYSASLDCTILTFHNTLQLQPSQRSAIYKKYTKVNENLMMPN